MFYQVISGTDPAHSDMGLASSIVHRNLEDAWKQFGIILDDIFKDYRRGFISKIHSVEIDIEDCTVVIRYEYKSIGDRIITRSLRINKVFLFD